MKLLVAGLFLMVSLGGYAVGRANAPDSLDGADVYFVVRRQGDVYRVEMKTPGCEGRSNIVAESPHSGIYCGGVNTPRWGIVYDRQENL